MVNQEQLTKEVNEILKFVNATLLVKGAQYNPRDNVFQAFENPIVDTDISIFLRAHNKVNRLAQLMQSTSYDSQSTVYDDTLVDLIGYYVLLLAYYHTHIREDT